VINPHYSEAHCRALCEECFKGLPSYEGNALGFASLYTTKEEKKNQIIAPLDLYIYT
jgi:hypothetical protein